jgi:phosphoribosyl 1,2-cyclic phosphodiesterase
LTGLCGKLDPPIYCNRDTREATERQLGLKMQTRLFQTGTSFEVGDIGIETFSVPHDASDPVGLVIRTARGSIGFLTDLGHATRLVLDRVRSVNLLVLEANHDLRLLQDDTRRPWSVKQRILSRHGHLSNEAAADVAAAVVSPDLRRLYLGHLSKDCNRPELAFQAVSQRMASLGALHVEIESASQDRVSPTLCL